MVVTHRRNFRVDGLFLNNDLLLLKGAWGVNKIIGVCAPEGPCSQ